MTAPIQKTFGLSPQLAKILEMLLLKPMVTLSDIEGSGDRLTRDGVVAMHRLRRRLTGTGVLVESQRQLGYWLGEKAKARALQLLGPDGEQYAAQ